MFRRLSIRYFAAHKLRVAFTLLGVALGVSAIVGIRLLNEGVARMYERTVDRIAGRTVLEVTNGDVGVPEEMLEEVAGIPGVGAAEATVHGFVGVVGQPGERLYVFGVDLLAERKLRDYDLETDESATDPLIFLAQPDSVALDLSYLRAHGLAEGDQVRVQTLAGPTPLTIRAVFAAKSGLATLFGGRLAVMDVFAAQRLLNLDHRFTQIDVGLAEGADLRQVERRLSEVVGGRGLVGRPSTRGETLERLLASNSYGFTLAGLVGITTGFYLVFNTMMVAVAQRRRELGILRLVGMRRREVLQVIALEAVALASLGALAGVPLGLLLARSMSAAFAENITVRYLAVEAPHIVLLPGPALLGVGLALVSALVGALTPASEAVRIRPIEAARGLGDATATGHGYVRLALAGLAIGGAAIAVWVLRGRLLLADGPAGLATSAGLLLVVALVAPLAVRTIVRRADRFVPGFLGSLASLAGRNIVRHQRRVVVSCAAFVVSVAGAIVMATLLSSLQRTVTRWFDSAFSGLDVVISSGAEPLSPGATPMPGALAGEMRGLRDVAHVVALREVKVPFRQSFIRLVASDVEFYRLGHLSLVEGDLPRATDAIARGEGAVVNEAFRREFHVGVGDELRLPAPGGEVRLTVAGICFDFSDMGEIYLDRALYRARWRDDLVTLIAVVFRPGVVPERAIAQIRERWGTAHDLVVITLQQFRREHQALLGQVFSFTYPLIGIALAIALLGVLNFLLISVLDRTREFGVLRAVGATRRQVAGCVMIESGVIGLVGGTLGVLAGSVLGWVEVHVMIRGMFNLSALYRYPVAEVVFALAAGVGLAAVAGYVPGRRAATINIREALRHE
jgi:putative ABC transport system permease protein